MTSIPSDIRNDTAFGFLDRTRSSDKLFNPVLISNVENNTMHKAILEELRRSTGFVFSVAFVSSDAIASLKQPFIDFEGTGRIITSTYLGFNSPETFRELLNLRDIGIEVFVYEDDRRGFHPKGFIFQQDYGTTAIVGSSNFTSRALRRNHEWNLRFSALPGGDIVEQLATAVDAQLILSTPLTAEWIQEYEARYVPPQSPAVGETSPAQLRDSRTPITPNAMQAAALEEIAKVRDAGESRALVVSATGTGKTILAALDVKAANPQRMLFVVHREQILDRAIDEFTKVLNLSPDKIGKFVGSRREIDRQYVFATVQSLGTRMTLEDIPSDHFDYVLIDEVHRTGATLHQNILEHFTPDFTLGITATPERTDGFNVYSLFDYNVPYEIRLQKALEEDMLAPFHYYGVTDFEVDGEAISDFSSFSTLVAPQRVTHLVEAIERYGHAGQSVRGLMFCSRKDEARELSELLNQRTVHGKTLRTRALTGDDPVPVRENVVQQLEAGELDYIITVDVFNEGIDIRTVNQVVMLRQTQSSIVFTQQLGRGLRKAAGKSHLIVIDFIGNYENNFLVPIALFGDSSLNKDSLRKHMIEAQEVGAVSGLSSISFDAISKERIFESIASTKLDSIKNLKKSFTDLHARLGRAPKLIDYARFDVADPVVVASTRDNYWKLLKTFRAVDGSPTARQSEILNFVTLEFLNGKRPHELLLLQELLRTKSPLTVDSFRRLLDRNSLRSDPDTLSSLRRIFSLTFFTDQDRKKYGQPIVNWDSTAIELTDEFVKQLSSSHELADHIHDVIETGLHISRHRYLWDTPLELGQKYSRKDVCRLLNWRSDQKGTMFGYKVDEFSQTCPIFVTYHKDENISASTSYEDKFVNETTLLWYTRPRLTLHSKEVQSIISNTVPLHLFAKKDDAEGIDFYYLGVASSSNPVQSEMPDDNGQRLDVVIMDLNLESAIDPAMYDYLTTGPVVQDAPATDFYPANQTSNEPETVQFGDTETP